MSPHPLVLIEDWLPVTEITVVPTERGVRFSKSKSSVPIDGVLATAMALDAALGEELDP
jgi:hypothetical protein